MISRLRLIDALSGKHSWRRFDEYQKTQWYTTEEIEQYQAEKLRNLLTYCSKYVPYYRRVIEDAKIDVAAIRDLSVLRHFPVTDKVVRRQAGEAFTTTSLRGLHPLRFGQTGGTTGEPLRFYKDAVLRSSSHAALYRFHEWMGVGVGDAKILVWGAPIVEPGLARRARSWGLNVATNTRALDPFTINRAHKDRLRRLFEDHRPVLVHGYCQAIYELACWFDEWGWQFPLRAVSTTVEPLFPEYRDKFRKVFSCAAFDQYGCSEVEMVAGECPAHEGLHVFPERAIAEVDEEGRILLTDLDNLASPFIRYRNGDVVEMSSSACSCGRAGRMIRAVKGRTGDIVVGVNGNRVHPEFFTHLLNELGVSFRMRLRRYQVRQLRTDCIEWLLVGDELSQGDRRAIVEHLVRYLGPMTVEIRLVSEIPTNRSGKFQYVVSQLPAATR